MTKLRLFSEEISGGSASAYELHEWSRFPRGGDVFGGLVACVYLVDEH